MVRIRAGQLENTNSRGLAAQEYRDALGNRPPHQSRPFVPTYQVLLSPPGVLVAEDLGQSALILECDPRLFIRKVPVHRNVLFILFENVFCCFFGGRTAAGELSPHI